MVSLIIHENCNWQGFFLVSLIIHENCNWQGFFLEHRLEILYKLLGLNGKFTLQNLFLNLNVLSFISKFDTSFE